MMRDLIQLRICAGIGSWLIPVSQNTNVEELFDVIARKCLIGIDQSEIRLHCGDIILEYGNQKRLKEFRLTHLSMVVALLPLCGGVWPVNAIKERKTNLLPLPGFITVTSLPWEPDMITFDDSPDEKRARMPCGHVIGQSSMASYFQSVLSKGQFKFYCPSVDGAGRGNCNREWDYFLVRHVAGLSSDEMQEFEKKLADNYLKLADGLQTCPGCNTWCFKGDDTGNYVRCRLCGKNFCWACMKNWISPGNSQFCGNPDCDGRDNRTRMLANCPTKVIGRCQACPSIRCCPKCGMLTEHKDACAHVTCPSCWHGFCFICLKGKTGRDWPCCPSGTCTLAPRQTSTSWRSPASQTSAPARQLFALDNQVWRWEEMLSLLVLLVALIIGCFFIWTRQWT